MSEIIISAEKLFQKQNLNLKKAEVNIKFKNL